MARHVLGAFLFGAAVILIAFSDRTPPAAGQKKKDNDKDEIILRQKVAVLQHELREREQIINRLQGMLKKERNEKEDRQINDLRKDLNEAQSTIREKDAIIANMKRADAKEDAVQGKTIEDLRAQLKSFEAMKKSAYVHTVIFKIRSDAPPDIHKNLAIDIPGMLGKIPTVRGIWHGRRAEEASPEFAVKDFEVAMVLLFDNADGLKRYLDHPSHVAFVEKYLKHFETPLVYDALKKP
jgi:hypothetical protein